MISPCGSIRKLRFAALSAEALTASEPRCTYNPQLRASSRMPEEDDLMLAGMRELARSCGLYVHLGSLAVRASADKAANRSFLIDPHGEIIARYDKIHMFDVDLASGESYRESRNYRAGEVAVLADLPWGRLGLTICYDL